MGAFYLAHSINVHTQTLCLSHLLMTNMYIITASNKDLVGVWYKGPIPSDHSNSTGEL